MKAENDERFYEFGPFRLDAREFVLIRDGQSIALTPKVFETLLVLVENSGRIVDKNELYKRIWQDAFVEETNLTKNISILRKILGEGDSKETFIETIPKRGYRFTAPVTRSSSENGETGAESSSVDVPAISTESAVEPIESSAALPATENWLRDRRILVILAALVIVVIAVLAANYRYSDAPVEKRSVAVLPFVNESGNPEYEYLSDGISETLINSLSELEQLKVIARGTAFRYKNRDFVPSEVGRELKVDSVLTGKVIAVGDTLIIQADLIDTKDGSQIWGERYTKKLADLISVPENISRGIIMSLQPKLSGEASQRFAELYPGDNSKAYQLDIKGRFFWNRRTEEGLRQGVEYFEQAIEEDPNYALAYVGLADSYNIMGFYTFRPPEDAFPKAKVAARKALELNPNLAEAHNSLAYAALYFEWDFVTAENEFLRAMKLKPNYAVAYQWYANLLTVQGRWEEALQYHKRAGELDPLSPVIAAVPGWTYYYARQYDKAIEACRQGIEFDPNVMVLHTWLGQAYERNGEHEKAIAEFKEALRISKGSAEVAALLAHAYAVSGNKAEAQTILNDLLAQPAQKYVSPFHLATLYTGLGDKDSAFKWLEVAYKDRQHVLLFLDHDPRLDDLRSDPRFRSLLERIKPS